MARRLKHDNPMSRTTLDSWFPNEAACARHMASLRWLDVFAWPAFEGRKGRELQTKPHIRKHATCHRQTSMTAGAVMHRSKLPLRIWLEAIHLTISHSNGTSTEQAQAQLGLGSCKTAWLLLPKLRRAMVNPARILLRSPVEVDETDLPLRSKHGPIAGSGIPNIGKLLVIGAVEIDEDNRARRLRLEPLKDKTGASVHGLVERTVERGAELVSGGLAGYRKLSEHKHNPNVAGKMAAHVLLRWIHRAFSSFRRWFLGTLHGVLKQHLRRYSDDFASRWTRRFLTRAAFYQLLGFTIRPSHTSERDFVLQRV